MNKVLALCVFFIYPVALQAVEVSEVLEAWRTRQEQIKTISLEWVSQVYRPTGNDENNLFDVTGSIVFDNSGMIRVENYHVNSGRQGDAEIKPRKSVCLFDGNAQTTFYPQVDKGFPAAFIKMGTTRSVANELWLAPICLAIRPLDNSYHIVLLKDIVDSGKKVEFQATSCIVYDCGKYSVWVTEDPRYLLVRLVYRHGLQDSTPVSDTQIEYKQEEDLWIPHKWRTTLFGVDEAQIVESRDATVTVYSVNEILPESSFKIDFPAGTWVQNAITDESYIVRNGKPNRPVIPGEYTGENYDQIRDSEPPSLGDPERRDRLKWLYWTNITVIIFLLLLYVIKRRTRCSRDSI